MNDSFEKIMKLYIILCCTLQLKNLVDLDLDLCGVVMDDDDPSLQNPLAARRHGKQGDYVLPRAGICWVWRRCGTSYVGLSIKDLSANRDLVVMSFLHKVKSATNTRGRRSCTTLPIEDRLLLKSECMDGVVRFNILGGSAVVDACLPEPATMSDVERVLHIGCPWQHGDAHRIELDSSSITISAQVKQQMVRTGSNVLVPDHSATSAAVIATDRDRESQISTLIYSIGRVLSELNQQQCLDQLKQLENILKVTELQIQQKILNFNLVFEYDMRGLHKEPNPIEPKQKNV